MGKPGVRARVCVHLGRERTCPEGAAALWPAPGLPGPPGTLRALWSCSGSWSREPGGPAPCSAPASPRPCAGASVTLSSEQVPPGTRGRSCGAAGAGHPCAATDVPSSVRSRFHSPSRRLVPVPVSRGLSWVIRGTHLPGSCDRGLDAGFSAREPPSPRGAGPKLGGGRWLSDKVRVWGGAHGGSTERAL